MEIGDDRMNELVADVVNPEHNGIGWARFYFKELFRLRASWSS